ncbi:Spondin-1 [Homalodisca vitripennis]|nr:Spondin-1 [Homalodisca vitripennis]
MTCPSLHGQRNHGQVPQKFTGFMLVVEPQNPSPLRIHSTRDVTPRPVGLFQLYGDTLTKFSPNCPNMVTHTSSMPKPEIQVRWTAPPPGSGCVIFRATVIEHRDVWYQDDGPLSKMLCEEQQENQNMQPEVMEYCCACDEAKYEVTFEGLWSRHTHPKDFPSNSWLTRFSDVIGASHSFNYRFWEYGGTASIGLKHVAERGSTRMLESELKSESSNIRTIIKARGISYPNVTGKTFAVFRVDKQHHLMSLVSMIDPSPDWIVGVSALELCLTNCSWVESKVLNLYPWDAGTDSGVTYISPDQQTFPQDKIRRITSSFPNDPRSPFYDSSGADMKPLARLYLTRQRLYEKTCEEEPITQMGCALSNWSGWGPCSATCGAGQMYRQRHFLHRGNARHCPKKVKLSDTRHCNSRHCRPTLYPTPEPIDSNCEVHEWTDWSRCESVDQSCRRGTQKRYRLVESRDNYRSKLCVRVPKVEERECRLSSSPSVCPKNARGRKIYTDPQGSTCCEPEEGDEEGDDYGVEEEEGNEIEYNETTGDYPEGEGDGDDYNEEPTGECAMTQWSVWSPCSVSCGVGESRRSRRLLNPPEEDGPRAEYQRAEEEGDYGMYDEDEGPPTSGEYAEGPCSIYKVVEVEPCNGTYLTCQFSPEDAREICALPPHEGRCPGPFLSRWYYNPKQEDCAQFQWSGCRGNKNRFLSREECRTACQAYTGELCVDVTTFQCLTTFLLLFYFFITSNITKCWKTILTIKTDYFAPPKLIIF